VTGSAPEVSDEALDLDLATARGGLHRLSRRGWLGYALWIFAPLGVALVIAAISSLPGSPTGRPFAGDAASALPPDPTPGGQLTSAVPVLSATSAQAATPSPAAASGLPPAGPTSDPPRAQAPAPTGAAPVLVSNTSSAPDFSFAIEAESAALGTQVKVEQLTGASGGSVVSGVGEGGQRLLTVSGIQAPAAASYRLNLAYQTNAATTLTLKSSAGTDTTVTCPATTGSPGWCAAIVKLSVGTNTVTLGATRNNSGLFLDRITLW
jgi:hypothetical protein